MTDEIEYIDRKYNLVTSDIDLYSPSKRKIENIEGEESPFFTSIRKIDNNLEKIQGIFLKKDDTVQDTSNFVLTENNVESLYKVLEIYRDKRFETIRYIFIDNKNGEIKEQTTCCDAMPNFCNSPYLSLDLKQYCTQNNYSVVLCHNHPSGNCNPSMKDDEITRFYFQTLSNNFLGHIILDHNKFSFFNKNSKDWSMHEVNQEKNEKDFLVQETNDGILNYKLKDFNLKDLNLNEIKELGSLLNNKDYYDSRFFPTLFSNNKTIQGVQFFSDVFFLSPDKEAVRKRIFESVRNCGGTHCFVSMPTDYYNKLNIEDRKMFQNNFILGIQHGCFSDVIIGEKSLCLNMKDKIFKNKFFSISDTLGEFNSTIKDKNFPKLNSKKQITYLSDTINNFQNFFEKQEKKDLIFKKRLNLAKIFNGLNKDEIANCWKTLYKAADKKREEKRVKNNTEDRFNVKTKSRVR